MRAGKPQSDGEPLFARIGSALAPIAFAQAEFFYVVVDQSTYAPSSLLWNMGWKARLRRFRLPEPESASGAINPLEAVTDACSTLAAAISDLGGTTPCSLIDTVGDLIVH